MVLYQTKINNSFSLKYILVVKNVSETQQCGCFWVLIVKPQTPYKWIKSMLKKRWKCQENRWNLCWVKDWITPSFLTIFFFGKCFWNSTMCLYLSFNLVVMHPLEMNQIHASKTVKMSGKSAEIVLG